MRLLFFRLATLLVILTGCTTGCSFPLAAGSSNYVLVTVPLDATVTPTPFRPQRVTQTPGPVVTAPIQSSSPPSAATIDLGGLLPDESQLATITAPTDAPPPLPLMTDRETVTYLLLGSDQRPGGSIRTDTIIVVALRPWSAQVAMISIPRDLWVYIPEWGMNKINTAYQHGENYHYPGGGAGLLKDTILYNLGIRIDHTAMVNFNGFKKIIDTLGGIDLPVACPYTDWHLNAPGLDENNANNWSLYTVYPGIVHMDGDLALWYARSRMKSNDYDRGRRQQEVLRAIYTQALRTDAIPRIPQLYEELKLTIVTDLGLTDLLQLVPLAVKLSNADIRSYYIRPPLITGKINEKGIYIQIMDPASVQALLQRALSFSPAAQEENFPIIQVWNGTLNEDWERLASERLNYAGYQAQIAAADRHDYTNTLLYDLTPGQDPVRSSSLLSVLGLPSTALVSAPRQDSLASYVLILGADYRPCFNPVDLSP